jgi:ATP adenylyltransferase
MTLERLWAGWRADYVGGAGVEVPEGGCLFCALPGLADDDALVVARDERAFVVLNLYPYTSGHLLVAPLRHECDLEALDADEVLALMLLTQQAVTAVKAAYRPEGVNIGLNLGRAAGAGIPGHLHEHIVPRWTGDTNFMTSVAEVRVVPEALTTTLERIRAAWPT